MENGSSSHSTIIDHDLHEQMFDLWTIVRRHARLIALCVLIWIGLGVLFYLNAPRTYESIAEIYIEAKFSPDLDKESSDEKARTVKTIEAHREFIRSKLIVGRAMKENGLDQLLSVRDDDNALEYIIDHLEVELTEENANVLTIRYADRNAEDCYKIVEAITKTYEDFLGEANQSVDKETANLIARAKDDLMNQLLDKDREYSKFQEEAPPEVLFSDTESGKNLHRERQRIIEEKRAELEVERHVLAAQIASHEKALEEGGKSREAIYFLARKELRPKEDDEWIKFRIQEYEHYNEREAMREYSSILVREYLELLVEKRKMEYQFDAGHPELKSMLDRISMTQRMLKRALNNQNPVEEVDIPAEENEEPVVDYVAVYMQMMRDRLDALDTKMAYLDTSFADELQSAKTIQIYLDRDNSLRSSKLQLADLYDVVVARLNEINLIREHGGDQINLLAPPELGEQVFPQIALVIVGSLFLGLSSGFCLAWIVDRAEHTFRSPIEIREALQAPVIGSIPFIDRKNQVVSEGFSKFAPVVCTVHRHNSVPSEAYRAVRTSLYFSTKGQDHKVIQISSPLPGDGKSTCVANLAVTIAKSGKSVLVVDADFRRPTIHTMLGLMDESVGLAKVVQGTVEPHDAIQATEVENLSVLAAGKSPSNPSELLSSPEFKDFLAFARETFDFVIVDTPPLLAVTDPSVVAARVDGVILALRIRKGIQGPSKRSCELLSSVGANVLGVLVNAVDEKTKSGYGYGYGYGYGRGYGYGYGYGGYGSVYGYGSTGEEEPVEASGKGSASGNDGSQPESKARFTIPGREIGTGPEE